MYSYILVASYFLLFPFYSARKSCPFLFLNENFLLTEDLLSLLSCQGCGVVMYLGWIKYFLFLFLMLVFLIVHSSHGLC